MATGAAADACKAAREHTAVEVTQKLALDEGRQAEAKRMALAGLGEEAERVTAHDLVEHRALGRAAHVRAG